MDNERQSFEAEVRQWPNFTERMLVRDGRFPEYYGNPVVQGAWEGWKMRARLSAQREGEADEVVCEILAVVRDDEDGPYLEFTGEGGLHDIPEGTPVWLLSGGSCEPENGFMSLYTAPPQPRAEVTEKMLSRACKTWGDLFGWDTESFEDEMRAALEAALSEKGHADVGS
jgi:hypothetical protein